MTENVHQDFYRAERPWLGQVSNELRPDETTYNNLENLRRYYNIPNRIFLGIYLSSPPISRRVLKDAYAKANKEMPDAAEKVLLESVFRGRLSPENPFGLIAGEDEIQRELQNIHSLEELIKRIVEIEREDLRVFQYTLGQCRSIAKKVDKVLEGDATNQNKK